MKKFEFTVKVVGYGEYVEDAWQDAADDLQCIANAIENDDLSIPEYKEIENERD